MTQQPPNGEKVQNIQALDLGNGIGCIGVQIVPRVSAEGNVRFMLEAQCIRKSSLVVTDMRVVNVVLGPVGSVPLENIKLIVDKALDGEKPGLKLVEDNQGTNDMQK